MTQLEYWQNRIGDSHNYDFADEPIDLHKGTDSSDKSYSETDKNNVL